MKKNVITKLLVIGLSAILAVSCHTYKVKSKDVSATKQEVVTTSHYDAKVKKLSHSRDAWFSIYDIEYDGIHYILVNNGNGVAITPKVN